MTTRFMASVLVASVAIDIDHVPQHLGTQFLTAGTPRPYTHSLLTILVVLALAAWSRGQRRVLLGVVLGLGIHFWRDLGEPGSGVPLLWPLSYRAFSLPHWTYVGAMTLVVACAAWRLAARRTGLDIRPGSGPPVKAAD